MYAIIFVYFIITSSLLIRKVIFILLYRHKFGEIGFGKNCCLGLLYDNKKDLADLYFYRTARSILMFGQLFCWMGVLPLNRIFYFAC